MIWRQIYTPAGQIKSDEEHRKLVVQEAQRKRRSGLGTGGEHAGPSRRKQTKCVRVTQSLWLERGTHARCPTPGTTPRQPSSDPLFPLGGLVYGGAVSIVAVVGEGCNGASVDRGASGQLQAARSTRRQHVPVREGSQAYVQLTPATHGLLTWKATLDWLHPKGLASRPSAARSTLHFDAPSEVSILD